MEGRRLDAAESEIFEQRQESLFQKQQHEPTDEVIEIRTIRKRYDDWENLCYEINEIIDKDKLLVAQIKSAPVSRRFILGKYFHILSSEAPTSEDEKVETICT